ncbi:MAG: Homoserine kinase [Candidatus Izimaplasma bacterium HR2]|nr:MAG: Homoserine kinase [Candidatus Izimaplasma bacterium HR2]
MDKKIISKLINKEIKELILHETRNNKNDIRYTYKCITDKEEYYLKMHSNIFTSIDKINSIVMVIEKYNSIGIYSPKIIKQSNNQYASLVKYEGLDFVVWIEEKAIYEFQLKSTDLRDDFALYIGKVSTRLKVFKFNYKSPYIMFEPYIKSDIVDEYEEYLNKVYNLFIDVSEVDKEVLEYVYKAFYEIRDRIKNDYQKLPSSVFQCDLQNGNVLVQNDKFIGLIDFNLVGREKILTYIINELAYQESKAIGNKWTSDEYIMFHVNEFKRRLKLVEKEYEFNNMEVNIINDLYKAIIPYKFYPLTEIIGYYKMNDFEEVNYRLLWMKRIIDIDLKLL